LDKILFAELTGQTNIDLITIKGGKYIVSHGEVKALVIFIQFSDDIDNTNGWLITNPPSLPSWANNIIGEDASGNYLGLTEYYDEMSKVDPTSSHGIYKLTGDVYPQVYVPEHPESYYIQHGKLKEVNEEVLTKLNPYIDYSKYDNCSATDNNPDGVVDMIFLIYRNFKNDLINGRTWTGNASFYLNSDLNFDGVIIRKDFMYGSGVQMRNAKYGYTYTHYVCAHEYGHHLFGGFHYYYTGNLSLMSAPAWNASRGMHAVERERLDWVDYQDKTSDDLIYISDYMTTNDIYRIPLYDSNNELKEYYLIENRQKISQHDWAGDKGIYIYHVTDINRDFATIDVMCADGNWDFTFHPTTETITRDYEDRNSPSDEMNYHYPENQYYNPSYICATPWYPENAAWGDDEDAFDLTFNNVFSPVSSPPSNNSYSNFTVEVTGAYGNSDNLTYAVKLFFNNPYAGKPAKVINFNADFSGTHPHLYWDANLEPDLSGYRVYKKLTLQDGQSSTTYTFTTSTSYTDDYFTIKSGRFASDIAEYWVVSVDNSGYLSVDSKHYDTRGSSIIQWKPLSNNNVSKFKLNQNYPNPFNPASVISYQLPQESYVKLTVYNSLGQKVKTLVNEIQQAGNYTVNFNASSIKGGLPSGIYYYALQAGSFVSTKKMILMK
jgi:M6 family metalloprotease-like protein